MSGNDAIFDVVVVGAGMVGATAAALLARSGLTVAVIESREPSPFDASQPVGLRVSAISPGAAMVLREAGAWRLVENSRHSPYRLMRVEDRDEASVVEFQAPEFGLERLGTIVENDSVQWALWQALSMMPGVERLCPDAVDEFESRDDVVVLSLRGGRRLTTRLLVGADGAESRIRERLGIRQQFWSYGQSGVVCVVESDPPNPGVAWQRFLDGGPVAFLPLTDGTSSIVWSCPEREAARLTSVGDEAFLDELAGAVAGSPGHCPGRLKGVGPRAAFPLTMRLSERYSARRAVLMGDAAHVMHPLAGQGVNMGLLDAAGLVELLVEARKSGQDIGDERVLQRYDRWRRSEAEVMSRGVHALRGLFLSEELGLLRQVGLGLVSRSWTTREAFIRRACGLNDNSPALARGKSLAELLH